MTERTSDDIERIADTLSVDFTAAVKAANRARTEKVNAILGAMESAEEDRRTGLAEVRRLQEEAAKIAAESLRMAEKVESAYREALAEITQDLNGLRGRKALPREGQKRLSA